MSAEKFPLHLSAPLFICKVPLTSNSELDCMSARQQDNTCGPVPEQLKTRETGQGHKSSDSVEKVSN